MFLDDHEFTEEHILITTLAPKKIMILWANIDQQLLICKIWMWIVWRDGLLVENDMLLHRYIYIKKFVEFVRSIDDHFYIFLFV